MSTDQWILLAVLCVVYWVGRSWFDARAMHFDWKEIRVELAEVERLAFGDAARMASAASRAKEQASVSEWAQGWNDACLHLALQLAAKAKDLSDEIGAKVKP